MKIAHRTAAAKGLLSFCSTGITEMRPRAAETVGAIVVTEAAATSTPNDTMSFDLPVDGSYMLTDCFGNLNGTLFVVEHLLNELTLFQGKMLPTHVDLLSPGCSNKRIPETELTFHRKAGGQPPDPRGLSLWGFRKG